MKAYIFMLIFVLVVSLATTSSFSEVRNDRFLILLSENNFNEKVQEVFTNHGISVEKFENINGFIATGNAQSIISLSKKYNVRSIEPDQIVYAIGKPISNGKPTSSQPTQTIEWGINAVKAPNMWASYQGAGVKVAVIDTGIDLSHPDLKVVGGKNYVRSAKSYNDDNGHGTHVAGIIGALNNNIGVVGVAPLVDLYAVKVLSSSGSGYLSDVVRGIDWSISNHMDVINMSLGANSGSATLEQALISAEQAGIITVAAAGNDGTDVDFPGAYSSTIAVGAIDSLYNLAYFSSVGNEVDVVGPGVSVFSTYKGGTYKTLNGTSMATPHIAGLAALYKDKYPGADLNSFRNILKLISTDLGPIGFDPGYGYGLPNAVSLLQ